MSQISSPRKLLWPLNSAYRLALWLRELRLGTRFEPVRRLRCPVVSIGNLSTGGSGKTPLAIALARLLAERGFEVDVLSRGYGRRRRIAARVDAEGSAEEFGDEPLLIARSAIAQCGHIPVFVAAQRFEAGLLAEAGTSPDSDRSRPRVHILDDGFQHRQLGRDVDILLLNRQDWQDRLLPAGNLREPLAAAKRASVIAIPGEDVEFESELKSWGWNGPIWRLRRKSDLPELDGPVIAFCGIARPDQFFGALGEGGIQLAGRAAFRDHHPYSVRDIDKLLGDAREKGAVALLTTEKDLVRLGKLAARFPVSMPLKTVGLRVEIEQEDASIGWLVSRLQRTVPPL